jgi:hypothetical protein
LFFVPGRWEFWGAALERAMRAVRSRGTAPGSVDEGRYAKIVRCATAFSDRTPDITRVFEFKHMPLPPAAARNQIHTRTVQFEGYERSDGLLDLEARISDVKTVDCELASGVRKAGDPIHEMYIRLTIDRTLTVVDAVVVSDSVPYPGYCDQITPEYQSRLVGLNLLRGFRKQVQAHLAGVGGCTHLTELLGQFPTAAIQTFAGFFNNDTDDAAGKPFQLDRCHALDTRGEAVRRYYPRWYANEQSGSGR